MRRRVEFWSALAAGVLAFVVGTSTAHAGNNTPFICQKAVAAESLKFVKSELKTRQKCIDANLKEAGSCAAPDAAKIQKAQDKLRAGIDKKCSLPPPFVETDLIAEMGFPGACADPNPLDKFTRDDLKNCLISTHEDAIINQMLPLEYDSTIAGGPLTDKDQSACQKNVAKATGGYVASVMKALQACRNGLLDCKVIDTQTGATECKLSGFLNINCATADQKTIDAIAKAKAKAEGTIGKCTNQAVTDLKVCEPDQTTAAAAGTCETDAHKLIIDNPDQTAATFDLLDVEYAKPGRCGDNRQNLPNEECDGTADTLCPGQCGSPTGLFACLCQDKPRTRVVEHANADLDNGWTGISHDSGIVEGGGYTSDLWDCDGPGGPDTICTVGPSCSNAPHVSCARPLGFNPNSTADSLCGAGNTCRVTEAGTQGPHCAIAFKHSCTSDAQCQNFGGPTDKCVTQVFHGAPLPLSSGGVSVCVVNVFKEDVTGTTDLATGAGAVRLHQNSITYLGGSQQQPCPVCGGFCSGNAAGTGPGTRTLCTDDSDCTGGAHCVTDSVCSWGPNIDKPCRKVTPFGGDTDFFGSPSVDCPFPVTDSLGEIDILFNPATTGTTTFTANTDCQHQSPEFNSKVCAGGTNQHRPCTTNLDCPGGTCNEQCWCPNGTFTGTQQPNACDPACLGGTNDAASCAVDSECPGGFCHSGDCRVNPSDTDSSQEGLCTTGPSDGVCSTHTFKQCNDDNGCTAAGGCPFCDPGETCVQVPRQCFVNPTISRSGAAGTPNRISAATFCIAGTNSPSVNQTAGLPGPGAITQPATTTEVGF